VGTTANVFQFKKAFDASDESAIGNLLGYPACCREFYKRVWVDDGLVDTTWPMAVATAAAQGAVDSDLALSPEGPLTPNPSPARGEGSTVTPGPSPARGEGSTTTADFEGRLIEVAGPAKGNILWRWMGVRTVPHLPCSFTCGATLELAERLIQVGRDLGLAAEMDWMLEILDWPAEWSALHGVAEIKTPVLKVSTRTDATPCKYTVRYQGRALPAEAAQGVRFPFLAPSRPALTESEGFKRGLEHAAGVGDDERLTSPGGPLTPGPSPDLPSAGARGEGRKQSDSSAARGEGSTVTPKPAPDLPSAGGEGSNYLAAAWYASDNGFSTVAGMDAAHAPLVAAAGPALAEKPGLVLDLGCGNGALLKKLHQTHPAVVPVGIDVDAERIAHARQLLPQFAEHVVAGNLFDVDALWPEGRRYALAVLMPGRLLEVTPDRAAWLRARLASHCDRILIYNYHDSWLARYGSLQSLATAAGLAVTSVKEDLAVGFAKVAEAPVA